MPIPCSELKRHRQSLHVFRGEVYQHSAAERCWLKRWWFTCRFRCFCVCQPRRLMDIDWFSCGILGASWYEVMDKGPAHPAWPGMAAVSALHHVAAKVALNGRANGATEPQRWRLQRLQMSRPAFYMERGQLGFALLRTMMKTAGRRRWRRNWPLGGGLWQDSMDGGNSG